MESSGRWIKCEVFNLQSTNVHVIHCQSRRCEICTQSSTEGCLRLRKIRELGNRKSRIILAESEKGLLHFCDLSNLEVSEPSWKTEGWETVFVGTRSQLLEDLDNILSIYKIGPHLSIFKRREHNQTTYVTVPIVKTALEQSLIDDLSHKSIQIGDKSTSLSLREGITQRLEQTAECVSKYILRLIPEINETTRIMLSEIIAHQRSVLGPLMPVILDDMVEEIYLDRPGEPIYFDHQKFGRCITDITFQEYEVPRIITLIRAESNLHLDRGNPSLKMDLKIRDALMRFSVSIPPLSPDGLHLEIRRAKTRPFSINDLIENGTMTLEAAAVLLFAISCRFNITITGGPGVGKTTLLNALDMATPKWWRKIYVEDVIESREQRESHQVRFKVDSMDEQLSKFSKSDEIIKCLHRSPDYLILGEIQTAEHSRALFQAITAGLRSIQTCHSDSASSLVSRWKLGHEIQNDNLALMDLIVTLERPIPGKSKRRISEIVEIRKNSVDGLLEFRGLNRVYTASQGLTENWSEDGSFMTRARDFGVESHIHALENLIETIRDNLHQSDFEIISEKMWFNGHPMKYVEHRV